MLVAELHKKKNEMKTVGQEAPQEAQWDRKGKWVNSRGAGWTLQNPRLYWQQETWAGKICPPGLRRLYFIPCCQYKKGKISLRFCKLIAFIDNTVIRTVLTTLRIKYQSRCYLLVQHYKYKLQCWLNCYRCTWTMFLTPSMAIWLYSGGLSAPDWFGHRAAKIRSFYAHCYQTINPTTHPSYLNCAVSQHFHIPLQCVYFFISNAPSYISLSLLLLILSMLFLFTFS